MCEVGGKITGLIFCAHTKDVIIHAEFQEQQIIRLHDSGSYGAILLRSLQVPHSRKFRQPC